MRIIAEEVDGHYYIDVVISPNELKRIKQNENIDGQAIFNKRKAFFGVRLQGIWDYDEDEREIK